MLVGRRPPEGGRNSHWTVEKRKNGKTITGWIAGPCVTVDCHQCEPTKPCLKKYLGAEHECVGCNNLFRVDSTGYQPIYRHMDGRPVVVIFHRDQFERLDALRHGQHVLIGWPEEKNVGAWIRKDTGPAFTTTLAERKVDADICHWLPILWKLVGVITADMLRAAAPDGVTTHCHTPTDSEELARMERDTPELLKRIRDESKGNRRTPTEAVGMGDVVDGYLGKTKVSRNGEHK